MYCIMKKGRKKDKEVKWFGSIDKARAFLSNHPNPHKYYLHVEYASVDMRHFLFKEPPHAKAFMPGACPSGLRPDAGKVILERPRLLGKVKRYASQLVFVPRSMGTC